MSKRRVLAVAAAVAGVFALGAGGGAVAGSLVTSADIRDGEVRSPDIRDQGVYTRDLANGGVHSADIRDGAVHGRDVSDELQARIDAPGEDGADGADGTDGAPGEPGASAYEIAVANGFEGTETEWLASLEGDPGAAGPPGEAGPPPCPDGYELSGPYMVRTSAQGTTEVEAFLCTPVAAEPPAE